MCQFKSAIVIKDEQSKGGFRLLMSPWTESHSELCTIHKLNDSANARLYFARVEFTPSSMDKAYLPEEYKLRIDEERTPDWFSEEMKDLVSEKMRSYIKSIIVDGEADLLIGGQYILSPNARVGSAQCIVINAMCGGTINAVCGGTINDVWGGTINDVRGGTINAVRGGTINDVRGGTINAVWGGTINAVWGGTINAVWGGTINDVRGGTINAVWGGTIIKIAKLFSGLIGRVSSLAKIVTDERQTPPSEVKKAGHKAKASK